MDMTSNRKLLLTLLLLLLTTSLFEGIIIKSLATCQGSSRRKHITFVMTLIGVPSGLFCYRWAEPCFFLTLFILRGQYYNELLFALVSKFYLHGNFEGSPVGRGGI